MKVVILCGGKGTRLREETEYRPKPMVPVGNRPILWHIMKIYALQGFNDFVVAGGYKFELIQDWAVKLDEPWNISVVDTGLQTQTGGRIKRCMEKFPDDRFFVTYGDGVGNIDLLKLLNFHIDQKRLATKP